MDVSGSGRRMSDHVNLPLGLTRSLLTVLSVVSVDLKHSVSAERVVKSCYSTDLLLQQRQNIVSVVTLLAFVSRH